jgi:DNA polymerase III subunit gamma/tau
MAHQTLYRRFRPQRFGEVRGQDNLVRTLQRAVAEDRVGHAYLFSGPRGTGKTTTARLLAKALNCEQVADGEPCGTCDSCVAIAEGRSFDVFEMDAASNRGIDDIRDLIDRATHGTPGRRKVYILDEVHMLSTPASNALLKTLEEPPEHVVFVLATTDPQKVLPTIRSRTQHFEVNLLSPADLAALVDEVIEAAGLEVEDATRHWVVKAGAGSARDTLSALERAAAMGGIPEAESPVDAIVEGLCDQDAATVLTAIGTAVQAGRSPRVIGDDLVVRLRDIFLTAVGAPPTDVPGDVVERVVEQAKRMGARGATRALDLLGEALLGIGQAPDPRVTLELAVVRIARPELDASTSSLLARIERLEAALAGGSLPAPMPVTAPAAATVDTATSPPPPPAPTPAPASASPSAAVSTEGGDLPAAPTVPAGDRPASSARQQLDARRGKGSETAPRRAPARPTPPSSAPNRPAAVADASPPPESTSVSAAPTPPPQQSSPPQPASAAGAPLGLDAVVSAWDRSILQSPVQKVRARFVATRVIGVDGDVVEVAVPNERVRQRCEDVRLQAEGSLGEALGRAMAIRLVVDAAGAAPPVPPRDVVAPPPTADDANAAADDDLPADFAEVAQLENATVGSDDPVDRFTDAFPGSTLVDSDPGATS